ncbi:MAG: hypothetical protein AAB152_11560 [Candidatus Coatesbacteria bacterium]
MKSRVAVAGAVGALVWVHLAVVATLTAPGHSRAALVFLPWLAAPRAAPLGGAGMPGAIGRAILLLAGAALLGLVCVAVGAGIMRWLRFRPRSGAEGAAVAFLLGVAAAGSAFFGLGLAGAFTPGALVAGLVLAALPGWRGGLPRFRGAAGAHRPPVAALLAVAYLALQFVPYWLCPETDQDALNFHLALPERFLRLHRVVLDPLVASTYAFRPCPADLVYALPVAAGRDAIARLLHGLALAAGLALVFGYADRRAGRGAAWLAVAACLAPLSLANVAARAKNDLFAASAAAGAWLVWLEGPRVPGRLLASSALAGCALAFKATTAAVVLPWGVCAAFVALTAGGMRAAAGGAGLAVLPVLPWLARTWLATGDPVYPHLSPRWFAGLAWDEGNRELNAGVYRFMSYRGPSTAVAGLLRLDVPFLIVLAPAAFLLRGLTAASAACAVVAYAGSLALQPAARYTIPAVWLASAVVVPVLMPIPGAAGRLLRAGVLGLAILPAMYRFPAAETMADDRVRADTPWPYLLGGQSRDGFLAGRLTTYFEMARALPGLVPAGRNVLLHHDARSYGLAIPALRGQEDADEPVLRRLARESAGPGELAKKLRQIDAGALAINPVIAYRYLAEAHPLAWDERSLGVYRDFAARRVTRVWSSPTEDERNGAYTVLVLGSRDHAPRPVPLLPGTAPVWSRVSYRAALGGGAPDAAVEAELLAIAARLPGVGEAWYKVGNYRFVTGARAKAAESYRRALADGYVEGILLARFAYSVPAGTEREGILARLRARCGPESGALLADAARWVR